MNTKKGWEQSLMISSLTKEASYGASVPVNASNFQGVKAHTDYNPEWGDEVQTDKDTVSGAEHGTDLDIIGQAFTVGLVQPRAKPNFVNAMMLAALGSVTVTQDAALVAYKQKAVPIAVGSPLPSFNLIGKKGGLQYLHKGCKVGSASLSGEEGKPAQFEVEIIGSGARRSHAMNAASAVNPASTRSAESASGRGFPESSARATVTQRSATANSPTPAASRRPPNDCRSFRSVA